MYIIILHLLTIQLIATPADSQETENGLDINSVCKLSKERYPDKYHTVQDILHTYSDCAHHLHKYSGVEQDTLMQQLLDRLECFKVDLKEQYYAGNIKYEDVEQVSDMEEELRGNDVPTSSVRCNTGRHSRETVQHVIPLAVTGTLTEKKKACEAIFKQQKRENLTEKDIPTPRLDNNSEPKELTVPLATPSTYRLDSPQAVGALTQYYKVVMKCLTLTTEHKIQVFKFNKRFYDWLEKAVLPHLKDDKCYPAFGGVLRIVETMKQNEFVPRNSTANFIFYRQKDLGKEEEERRKSQDNIQKVVRSSYFLLIALPLVLLILLILLYLCWIGGYCYSLFCNGKDYETNSTSSTEEIFYYPIEDSHSVSIILDDVDSEANLSSRSSNYETGRQRGGAEYKFNFQQKKTLLSLPLKRLLSSRNSSNGYEELTSPGKRQKKT